MNWSPDDPRRFAIRLDAEAMCERSRALLALHNNDPIAADNAYQRAIRLLHAAGWAAMKPELGLQLCASNDIYDVK
jgi:ABC-type metal ion transport system substrate-binding protein